MASAISAHTTTMPRRAAGAPPDRRTELEPLYQEMAAVQALRDKGEAEGWPDAVCKEWERRETAFLRKVEALPVTQANAPIKARAIALIYDGKPADVLELIDHHTTDLRLAVQVIEAMAGLV